jgi:predicted nucleotidyltransferase
MGQALADTAMELGCSERTLQRYVNDGVLRGRRVTPQLELASGEESYLRTHWTLLKTLKAVLRTERDVRLAVLFGSTATGEDRASSDVDVLIAHRRSGQRVLTGVRLRLRGALGKPVQLVSLEQAQVSPSLLADILQDGRVLIDRDGLWGELTERYDDVLRRAVEEERASAASARGAVAAARGRGGHPSG